VNSLQKVFPVPYVISSFYFFLCCAEPSYFDNFMSSFALLAYAFGVLSKSHHIRQCLEVFHLFSSSIFIVLDLIFRSLIHFVLIFVQGDRSLHLL
jgi:hypothetical protein